MIKRVLIIGGYGNFGSFIVKELSKDENIQLAIVGRNIKKAKVFAKTLQSKNVVQAFEADINLDLKKSLKIINPDIVIHTSGPYQEQGYHVAECCIEQGCHYIDLADSRAFVKNIGELDHKAKDRGVLVCSGASSVPCLSAAVIDAYKNEFYKLTKIEYGITTSQRTKIGLATTQSILSYVGKPFKTLIDGEITDVYGWMNLRFQRFWKLGRRPLGNCDIPDLSIFPVRYENLKTIRFQAGIELKFLHVGLWLLSWPVRIGLLSSLQNTAKPFLKISNAFNVFGTNNSGFYMILSGTGKKEEYKTITFDLVAHHGHGQYIPCMPSVIMARKLVNREISETGAKPCLDYITMDEYLYALKGLDIEWRVSHA